MEVLLIQPRMSKSKRLINDLEGYLPPLMLLYLAKPLVEKEFAVDILDLSAYNINARRFKEYIEITRPTIVGITCTTLNFSEALKTARYVKEVNPAIKIIIGGPHVTFTARETLTHDCIDIVVRGEGDINFPQLVEHFLNGKHSLAEIYGISYRQNGKILETPRKTITDTNPISFPPRGELLDLSRYVIPGSIQASRGCPFKCHFCSASAMAGGKYRMRNIDNIFQEIDYLVVNLGINHLAFLDDTMTAYPEITKALCRHILEKGYAIKWYCESRVDVINIDLIKLMAMAGCYGIQFGFESGSPAVLKAMNKKITPQQIENAVEICLDSGLLAVGNFLIGFPEDTKDTLKETFELAKKIKQKKGGVDIGIVIPYPGTYYYNHAEELGITLHTNDWDDFAMGHTIISTRNFTRDELREIAFDFRVELGAY